MGRRRSAIAFASEVHHDRCFRLTEHAGRGKDRSRLYAVVTFDDYGSKVYPSGFTDKPDAYEAGRKYLISIHITNYTDTYFNYKNDKEFTADNSTVKATINGQKANITIGSARPLTFEMLITMPGTRDPHITNMALSEADGEHAGFGYVDLGLPSGTMWATCNVGAAKPEALGDMYAYGETKTKKIFTDKNFIGYGAYTLANPYHITSFKEEDEMYSVAFGQGIRKLKPEYDAARQNMGGEWSLPSRYQCNELRANCYTKYVRVNGVEGTLYTSLKNGKSIFIPYTSSHTIKGEKYSGGLAMYMTANSGRVKHMYVRWWGSSCTLNEMNNTWAFQNNTFMWNEDALGGTPTHMGLHIRAVWGGEELTPRKAREEFNSKAGKKSKAAAKKSSDDNGDTGEDKKESAKK